MLGTYSPSFLRYKNRIRSVAMSSESATVSERFEKRVEFRAAFNKRHDDPKKDYGIHGVDITFALKGELGAVVGSIFTNWHLPEVRADLESHWTSDCKLYKPTGGPVLYHSPKPKHEEDEPADDCPYIEGPCYSDISFLNGEDMLEALIRGGDEGVWNYLEGQYRLHLGPAADDGPPEKAVGKG